ncbi:hypothetical protein GCM10010384_06770 [Streptomyces djakartensis]|uniref:Uncharacterized protein n=1 Tax=Streptomyces djakartensis TaxID=68193 RepID=A0ABQ2Z4Y6_9ACTN|nr:hypothetical protein GCM10010384_06770 [Streptomyces djakartensis]
MLFGVRIAARAEAVEGLPRYSQVTLQDGSPGGPRLLRDDHDSPVSITRTVPCVLRPRCWRNMQLYGDQKELSPVWGAT